MGFPGAAGEGDVSIGVAIAGVQQANANIAQLAQQIGVLTKAIQELNAQHQNAGQQMEQGFWSKLGDWGVRTAGLIYTVKNLGSALKDVISLAATPIQWGINAAQMALPYAQQGVQQSWDLATSTQNTIFGWGYLFGQPNQQGYDTSGNAQKMYQWLALASLNMPFTRQDAMAAVTSMATINADADGNKMTPQQIQEYLPVLSDLASTMGKSAYGGRGMTLQQAAYAVREASMGYTRMLRMELNIKPEDLVQYGLVGTGTGMGFHVDDPATFLPALEAYTKAHGLYGASAAAARNTWSGAWSSFLDRAQNFATDVGGIAPQDDPARGIQAGSLRPGSMLARMQSQLLAVSDWMDDPKHQAQIAHWADLFQNTLGGGVQVASNVLQGFLKGLKDTGALDWLQNTLTGIGTWLNSPQTQQGLQHIGDVLGTLGGPALKTIGDGIQGFLQGLSDSGAAQQVLDSVGKLGVWFADPQHKAAVKDFFTEMGRTVGDAAGAIDKLLTKLGNLGTWFGQQKDNLQSGNADAAPFVQGIYDNAIRWQVDMTMSPDDQRKMAANNPFAPPKDVPKDQIHTWALMVREAMWQELLRENGGDEGKAQQVYNQWLAREQQQAQAGAANGPTGLFGFIGDVAKAAKRAAGAGGAGSTKEAYTQAGTQGAQDYLLAFHQTVATQTQSTVVDPFTQALTKQIGGAGGAGQQVAAALLQVVSAAVSQAVADALNAYAKGLGNAGKVPGGYRPAGVGVGGLL